MRIELASSGVFVAISWDVSVIEWQMEWKFQRRPNFLEGKVVGFHGAFMVGGKNTTKKHANERLRC